MSFKDVRTYDLEGNMPLTASKLRENVYRILDEVLATGTPVEVERNGRLLRIVPVEAVSGSTAATRWVERPDVVIGDPEDLVHLDWSKEWRP